MLAKKGSVAPQSVYLMTGFLYAMTLTRKPYEGDFFIEVSEGFVKFDGLFLWHARVVGTVHQQDGTRDARDIRYW